MPIHPSTILRAASSAVLGILVLPAIAGAATPASENTPLNFTGAGEKAAEVHASSGGSIVRTIVGLAVVIGVIYGLTWVMRQVKASKSTSASGSGLESVATLPLGTNKALHLIRTGDELVLVGAGDHGVTPIRTYTLAEARALGIMPDEALADDDDGDGWDAPRRSAAGRVRGLLDGLRNRTVIR
jgi:flagellar protein FliO/FliZ